MRFSFLALSALALNANLLVAAQTATKTGAASNKASSVPGSSYEQVVLELIAKKGVQVPVRFKTNWDKDNACTNEKCQGNQVTDRRDPEKCRECLKGQKPNPDNTKCIRDDTGCADDEIQKDDKKCGKCPGTDVADSTGKKCVDLATCTGNQARNPDDESRCKDCPAGQKPNPDDSRCLREDTGCADDEVQKDDKTCDKCEEGKKGDKDSKTCVDKNKKEDTSNKQGKCPQGQVLNPAKGGRDENTENPSCIPDDDSQCKDGTKAATRSKEAASDANAKPECAIDEDPGFECKNSELYHHKKVVDGKIDHTCRTTEKSEDDKKKKYEERTKKPSAQTPKSKDKDDKTKKKRRARGGWCFVELASMGIWDSPELENMSQDEMDGLVELALPEVANIPENSNGDIPDYMVYVRDTRTLQVTIDGTNSAGFGGWIAGIAGAVAKSVPKAIKGATQGASKIIKEFKSGSRGTAAVKAVQQAKQSKVVDRILRSQEFKDCITSLALEGAAAALAGFEVPGVNEMKGFHLKVGWTRTDPGDVLPPEGQEKITLVGNFNENDGQEYYARSFTKKTKSSKREVENTPARLPWQKCDLADEWIRGQMSWVKVDGGCCAFYSGENCEGSSHLFDMDRREDPHLKGASNDNIRSWWCNNDCKGRPGEWRMIE